MIKLESKTNHQVSMTNNQIPMIKLAKRTNNAQNAMFKSCVGSLFFLGVL
jgi:hypothetical protein